MTEKTCCGGRTRTGSAPASNPSCCGGPVQDPAAAVRRTRAESPCCDAGAAPAQKSSCCALERCPRAGLRYGPAPYVIGARADAGGPRAASLRRAHPCRPPRHLAVRWGIGRDDYRVRPGLYALGAPGRHRPRPGHRQLQAHLRCAARAPCAVSTPGCWWSTRRGINVWCAAGKGTFSADEVARMVAETRLAEVVESSAPDPSAAGRTGVAAHRVKEPCGFRATFGPVRAADIPALPGRRPEGGRRPCAPSPSTSASGSCWPRPSCGTLGPPHAARLRRHHRGLEHRRRRRLAAPRPAARSARRRRCRPCRARRRRHHTGAAALAPRTRLLAQGRHRRSRRGARWPSRAAGAAGSRPPPGWRCSPAFRLPPPTRP